MGGMFAPYEPDQRLLLPPSLREWLPEDHLVYFIADTVDQLDLAAFETAYRSRGSGNVPYHPRLMVKLLVYAYATGVFSSRRIARQIEENIAFRVLAAGQAPAHRTISRFRQDHIERFKAVFVQVVQIACESGLTSLGTVAIDGTKLKANASKHKAMSYGRMQEEEKRLCGEIASLVKAAEDADAQEDRDLGPDVRGDELPSELKRRQDRLAVIQAAKQRLEARKREEQAEAIDAERKRKESGESRRGPKRKHPLGQPKPADQENFTDPDSRIMKTGSGAFEQCFNAQAAVDADHQIIVAADVSQCAADTANLVPMVDAVIENTEAAPERVLADAGYKSEANFVALEERSIETLVPLGRERGEYHAAPSDAPATQRMEQKLRSSEGRLQYACRKHIVEPVMGWVKRCLGFRSFSMRGLTAVRGEWNLVCLALNLRRMSRKLARN